MPDLILTADLARKTRLAGLLYLVIIVAGLGAELGLRAPLIDLSDAVGTATAILAAPGQFRLAIAADLVMALCDTGLAILLYMIFRIASPGFALSAMVFRLIQTVLIAANLMVLQAAWLLISDANGLAYANALALILLDLHGHGYDLGLVFFRYQQSHHGSSYLAVRSFREDLRSWTDDCRARLSDRQRPALLRAGMVPGIRTSLSSDDCCRDSALLPAAFSKKPGLR